jgi:hypothetical protein
LDSILEPDFAAEKVAKAAYDLAAEVINATADLADRTGPPVEGRNYTDRVQKAIDAFNEVAVEQGMPEDRARGYSRKVSNATAPVVRRLTEHRVSGGKSLWQRLLKR